MIARGHCHVYFAFLAASRIDLERAQAIECTRPTERSRFQRDRRAPAYLDFDPPPLQITLPCEPVAIGVGPFASEAQVDVTVFDFGAFSVDYRIPFAHSLEELARLSSALYDHAGLLAAARARVDELADVLRRTLGRARPRDLRAVRGVRSERLRARAAGRRPAREVGAAPRARAGPAR